MLTTKATASRIDILESHKKIAAEYREAISQLLQSPEFSALADFRHHKMTRQQHSFNVSWYGFRLARLFRLDAAAAARSGLLHDLFYYNFREAHCSKNQHIYQHPQQALVNARQLTELSPKEEDIILNHMWPMCPRRPQYKETYLVSLIDKYCCLLELLSVALKCSRRQMSRAAHMLANII